MVAVAAWPPLAQLLPKPLALAERVPPPYPVVGVAFLSEVAVAVDVEEVVRVAVQVVVRVAVQVVVRVRVAVPWWGTVVDPVVAP